MLVEGWNELISDEQLRDHVLRTAKFLHAFDKLDQSIQDTTIGWALLDIRSGYDVSKLALAAGMDENKLRKLLGLSVQK